MFNVILGGDMLGNIFRSKAIVVLMSLLSMFIVGLACGGEDPTTIVI